MKIIKRNGAEATFDISKIIMAITKANAQRRQKNKRRQPNDKRRQPPRNKGRRLYLGKTARQRNMIPRRRATASHTGPIFRP